MTYERFAGSSEFGDPSANEYTLNTTNAEQAFRQFHAQVWIDSFRADVNGKLDIEATAANVGVPVLYEMPIGEDWSPVTVLGCVEGLRGDGPVTVHLNPERGVDEHTVTFGHELGHIFIQTAAGIVVERRRDEVERFCDFFGRQMALPTEKLATQVEFNAHEVAVLAERYGVRYTTVIHQLMLAEKLPRRIVVDTGIGRAANTFYSNKVSRHVVCLDCEMENPHSTTPDLETPHFDFTDYDWSTITSVTDCDLAMSKEIDEHVALNKAYGRWTDADEAMIPAERERSGRIRHALSMYSMWPGVEEPDYEQNVLF
jgi:hypothetical protein